MTLVQIQPDGSLAKTGPKTLLVTRTSATAVADEDNNVLDLDHSRLVKYQSKTQDDYNIAKERLKTLVAEAKREVGRCFAEDSKSFKFGWMLLNGAICRYQLHNKCSSS